MKTVLLLSLGFIILFLGVMGRAGVVAMSVFYPENVVTKNG